MIRHINNQDPAIFPDKYEPGSYDEEAGLVLVEALEQALHSDPVPSPQQQDKLFERLDRLELCVYYGQGGPDWVQWWEDYRAPMAASSQALDGNESSHAFANDSGAASLTRPERNPVPSLVNVTEGGRMQAHALSVWGASPIAIM